MSELSVEHVRVTIAGRALVDDVSFSLSGGRWVSVIGPNGAGKTTLVEVVAGVRRASSGRVLVDTTALGDLGERQRAQRIAYVPQHPVVPRGMSVRDYVGLGRTAHQGVLQALSGSDHDLVDGVIDRVALADLARRDVSTLSGGERQRAVLARALAQSTGILVLDEPTTGLDLRHQIDMLTLLRREVDENALCIVATLHDLTLAGQYADELILLHEGRVLCAGASAQIVRSEQLVGAYGVELRVIDVDGADVVVPLRVRARVQ